MVKFCSNSERSRPIPSTVNANTGIFISYHLFNSNFLETHENGPQNN
jgi:hypothetical protein